MTTSFDPDRYRQDAQYRALLDRYLDPHERQVLGQVAQAEAADRYAAHLHAARGSLAAFATLMNPRYVVEPFHEALCGILEDVLAGGRRRVMIFAPPQHGKTELISKLFPAYHLLARPDDPIILTSYEATLATKNSAEVRRHVEGEAWQTLSGGRRTRTDSRAKNQWLLDGQVGGTRAAGMRGGLTGHGAGLAVIDDPVKNYDEAASAVIQESNFEWYETVLRTRVWEGGSIILVMTRWHERDLAGMILNSKEAAQWEVIRFPALAETQAERDENNRRLSLPAGLSDPLGRQPGEALAPRRYSAAYLRQIQDASRSYSWWSLYQGVPRPSEGRLIKRAWLQIVDEVPETAERVRYWDLAGTAGGGARTASVLMAKADGKYYVEDVIAGHWGIGERNDIILQTAALDALRYATIDPDAPDADPHEWQGYNSVRIVIEQEPGSSGVETIQNLVKHLAGYPATGDRVTGSKDSRIEPFASQAAVGQVFLKRAPWNAVYIDELASFPDGMYRDQGDATSGAFNKLHVGPSLILGIASPGEVVEDDAALWRRIGG